MTKLKIMIEIIMTIMSKNKSISSYNDVNISKVPTSTIVGDNNMPLNAYPHQLIHWNIKMLISAHHFEETTMHAILIFITYTKDIYL